MHGTGPEGHGWEISDLPVWPGRTVSSYFGLFVQAIQDEGTYEIRIPISERYNFRWEGNQWNDPVVTMVINDSAERQGIWSPGLSLSPDWDEIYNTCLFTKGITIEFLNAYPVPTTFPMPEIKYISNSGNGGPVVPPYPLNTQVPLSFDPTGVAVINDTITINDPVDPVYGVHCKVYSFILTQTTNVSILLENSSQWNSFLTVVNVLHEMENFVGESDPNVNLDLQLDAGPYYVLPRGRNNDSDVGDFKLTVKVTE
jgi:hypothetical protein